jgi:alanine dehydrogenase
VLGPLGAVRANPELARGVNIWRGRIVYPAVAAAVGETPLPLSDLR